MNAKALYLALVIAAFLGGAFVSVLDPVTVDWRWMGLALAVGAVGLWGFRRAVHTEASAGHRLSGNMEVLAESLRNIARNLDELNSSKGELPAYNTRFEIDRLFREDLNRFAQARETMVHTLGMKNYAAVMSAFAAGERYINRVWSASTDGYEDEVHRYLERAHRQFSEAESLFSSLRNQARSATADGNSA